MEATGEVIEGALLRLLAGRHLSEADPQEEEADEPPGEGPVPGLIDEAN
ncbi:hypothetical protein [Planobispora rosea]|nr:hypothetical protein [Planobispora rosea]